MKTQRDILTEYHKSEKIREGIGFIAKPPPAPQPEAPDPLVAAQLQVAQAYFELSKIYRGIEL